METNTYIYIIGKFVHFFTKISKFSSYELSDHCIIWFSLKTPNSLDSITKCKQDDIYTYSIPGKFCVDNGKSDYITLLENDEDQEHVENLNYLQCLH
jgi:hypothetical protein